MVDTFTDTNTEGFFTRLKSALAGLLIGPLLVIGAVILLSWNEGRAVFIDIYDVDPEFDLAPAEAGHPEWRQTFASAKAQAKQELAAKAARGAKEKAPAKKN